MENTVPVCDKRYHIYNRIRHFGAEIKKLWNYPFMYPEGAFAIIDNVNMQRCLI